jgi:hypothetical protein
MNDLQKINRATDLIIQGMLILQSVAGMTPDQDAKKIKTESAKTDELLAKMK